MKSESRCLFSFALHYNLIHAKLASGYFHSHSWPYNILPFCFNRHHCCNTIICTEANSWSENDCTNYSWFLGAQTGTVTTLTAASRLSALRDYSNCNVACSLTQMRIDVAGGKLANVVARKLSPDVLICSSWFLIWYRMSPVPAYLPRAGSIFFTH